ncbi:MAG: hypothetical protein ABL982_20310 [Vicinamibacterales bacterium]
MARNGHLNRVLYAMCEAAPDHHEHERVRAKVVIIGRSYAAGLERHLAHGLEPVTDALVASRSWLDNAISELRAHDNDEPAATRIGPIAALHGRLLRRLEPTTRNGNSVRSFVSKYLHFHAPVVPIYDQYADAALSDWYPWKMRPPGTIPKGVDEPYWRHCVRTAFVAEEWQRLGLGPVTARGIDDYAIAWWEKS